MDKSQLIHPGERLDDLYRNGYHIIQNPEAFCFGIDAVLLSDFARVKAEDTAVELGTEKENVTIHLK